MTNDLKTSLEKQKFKIYHANILQKMYAYPCGMHSNNNFLFLKREHFTVNRY